MVTWKISPGEMLVSKSHAPIVATGGRTSAALEPFQAEKDAQKGMPATVTQWQPAGVDPPNLLVVQYFVDGFVPKMQASTYECGSKPRW